MEPDRKRGSDFLVTEISLFPFRGDELSLLPSPNPSIQLQSAFKPSLFCAVVQMEHRGMLSVVDGAIRLINSNIRLINNTIRLLNGIVRSLSAFLG